MANWAMFMAKVLDKPNVLRALTGLNTAEFDQLVDSFSKEWNNHLRKNWLGRARQRAPGAGPKAALESIELKLLFILVHFRLYPIQEVLGFLFGMKQPQANRWIMRLTPLLEESS